VQTSFSGDSFNFAFAFPLPLIQGQKGRFERDKLEIRGRTMKNLFLTALAIAIVIAIGSAVKPYWDKYWIQKELEVAAVYGTKNSLENTKAFLLKKLKEEGYRIEEEDIYIEKDSKKSVTVTVRYSDEISIFGKEIQKLHFTLTATEREIKAYY
jgi:hypothetical protein